MALDVSLVGFRWLKVPHKVWRALLDAAHTHAEHAGELPCVTSVIGVDIGA